MTDTNELRKLLDAATPGPWRVRFTGYNDAWLVVGWNARRETFDHQAFDDGSAWGTYNQSCTDPTRDLIVAAVNALPALLDELDAAHEAIRMERERTQKAEAEVERLRDEAAKWHNLLPVYEDAEREVQQLRADLREALSLLRDNGDVRMFVFRADMAREVSRWARRCDALLATHKETP